MKSSIIVYFHSRSVSPFREWRKMFIYTAHEIKHIYCVRQFVRSASTYYCVFCACFPHSPKYFPNSLPVSTAESTVCLLYVQYVLVNVDWRSDKLTVFAVDMLNAACWSQSLSVFVLLFACYCKHEVSLDLHTWLQYTGVLFEWGRILCDEPQMDPNGTSKVSNPTSHLTKFSQYDSNSECPVHYPNGITATV